jgi:hypothetical protein
MVRVQVAVPDGGHAGVDLTGVAEELVRPLVVACGLCGSGVQDQPPGGDLLPVLLPEPGTGRIQGSGLVGQLPGLIQISGPVGLVGSHSCAVGIHTAAVARIRGGVTDVFGLRADVPAVTAGCRTRSRCGWMVSGMVRSAGFLSGCSGAARFLLGHSV